MKWNETVASDCRYGEIAARIWSDANVIWEDSESDYQGHATVLARTPDGKWWFYEWWYGSCSGCDTWEAAELTDDEIEAEMRDQSAIFDSDEEMGLFLSNKEPIITKSRTFDTGGLVGMIDILTGGTCERPKTAYAAFQEYMIRREVR